MSKWEVWCILSSGKSNLIAEYATRPACRRAIASMERIYDWRVYRLEIRRRAEGV